MANADAPLNLDRESTEFLSHKALIRKEKIFTSKFMVTSQWETDITGVAASPTGSQVLQWNDDASDPLRDIEAGIEAVMSSTGFAPNTLVLGRGVWSKLKNHPDIIDRVKYGTTNSNVASATIVTLAALIGEDIPNFRVVVMSGVENSAKEGQTAVNSFINRDKALLVYSAPSPGLMTPSGGYDFQWTGLLRGTAFTQVKRFRMESLESDRVEIQMAFDMKLVSSELGYFFTSIIA